MFPFTHIYEYNLYSLRMHRHLVNTRKQMKIFIIKQKINKYFLY